MLAGDFMVIPLMDGCTEILLPKRLAFRAIGCANNQSRQGLRN
jgi:hypothetical protein